MPSEEGLLRELAQRISALEAGVNGLTDRLDRHCADNEKDMTSLRDALSTMLSARLETLDQKMDMLTKTVESVTAQQWTIIRVLIAVLVVIVLTYIGARELAPKILGI